MDPTRPLKWTLWFLQKFRDFWENFGFFYILYSPAPLTMLEHLFGHCPTVPRLRGPSWTLMDPTRPLKWTLWFLRKFRDFWENFGVFYILYSLAPLTMLEHLFGHCPTVPMLRGPSWTFLDPQMDPEMDPARLISEDPWWKRARQGPFMAQTDQFF